MRTVPRVGPGVCLPGRSVCLDYRLSHGCVEGGERGCFPKLSFASTHKSVRGKYVVFNPLPLPFLGPTSCASQVPRQQSLVCQKGKHITYEGKNCCHTKKYSLPHRLFVLGASAPAKCQTHTLITSRLCSPGCADTHL